MDYIENVGCFEVVLDPYSGITISKDTVPFDNAEFEKNLINLINISKNKKRRLIWITIDIDKSYLIPTAVKHNFEFHTCEKDYVFMVKRLVDDAIIPTAVNHTLGVGVVVINEANEILVIKERVSRVGYKLPGGHIDNGELISNAAVREAFEETGVKVEFDSIISIGHFYPHQFDQSNLYVLCSAKPLTYEISIKDTAEIEDAKWVDVFEFLQDDNVFEYNKKIIYAALSNNGFFPKKLESFKNLKKDYELFFPKQQNI
ncbi:DNA mismatch repair protein MutT [Malaciobacter molluscorum LMG 25693]|uniref:DNA mismatch repair protein MutT n=1 Tax=Malaciobacter molluscorum LMG 25693 TaxID=870501 RepID=A0A2G1DHK2_9BACT|nr:NUDIX domain-containing protein [Malaciobacter molluscorum]AXX93322.1 Nudix domain-containing protein [Malaciobacter molluscorum LMG 25693]PHO17978.1 DNA mismatch repair protein MutT [Malaciobacter molluscorum LMG 25693]